MIKRSRVDSGPDTPRFKVDSQSGTPAVKPVIRRPSSAVLSGDNSYMFYFSQWTKNTSSFRNLLNSSKGRDKFC